MRTRVKICGITSVADAQAAVQAGADAVGLVFYPPSSRYVDVATAADIVSALGPFVTPVGLFVNAKRATVEEILARVPLGLLQFHGDESPEFCVGFGVPYVKAVRMAPDQAVVPVVADHVAACAILLDSFESSRPGGTGRVFDWARIPSDLGKPLILAGGLTPDNVGDAIAQVHPYAVDVSGGVEWAPGRKDAQRMQRFCQCVQEGCS